MSDRQITEVRKKKKYIFGQRGSSPATDTTQIPTQKSWRGKYQRRENLSGQNFSSSSFQPFLAVPGIYRGNYEERVHFPIFFWGGATFFAGPLPQFPSYSWRCGTGVVSRSGMLPRFSATPPVSKTPRFPPRLCQKDMHRIDPPGHPSISPPPKQIFFARRSRRFSKIGVPKRAFEAAFPYQHSPKNVLDLLFSV